MTRTATLALFAALSSCGGRSPLEPGDEDVFVPPPGVAGSLPTAPGGSGGSGAQPMAEGGGSSGSAGMMSQPPAEPVPEPDVNCTSDRAKGGMACTAPCVTTCGFYGLGTRTCDCVSGVFVSCHCPRPWNYQGQTTAPTCATPDGKTHWLDNTACTEEWQQCIGTDPYSGTNPRGCVCLTDPVNGKREWTCGSTNRWFLAE